MSLATAYVIYNGTNATYVGWQNQTIQINCDRLRSFSPRKCWLKRELAPGDGTTILYILTFNGSDPAIDDNTIQGYMIEVDGQDVMIDIDSWESLVAACNCPDCNSPDGNVITRYYTSGINSFVTPTLNTICVTRSDDGSGYAHDVVVTDYLTQYVGTVRLKSNTSGQSVYEMQTFMTLAQFKTIGSDTAAYC